MRVWAYCSFKLTEFPVRSLWLIALHFHLYPQKKTFLTQFSYIFLQRKTYDLTFVSLRRHLNSEIAVRIPRGMEGSEFCSVWAQTFSCPIPGLMGPTTCLKIDRRTEGEQTTGPDM